MSNVISGATDLPKLYRVIGFDSHGARRAGIVLRRKPSEIPITIDRHLLRLAGAGKSDGPNSVVIYEFLLPEKLSDAEDFLRDQKWQKVKKEENELGDWWVSIQGSEFCKKQFEVEQMRQYTEEAAETYLDDLMTGKV